MTMDAVMLRTVRPEDETALFALFAAIRSEELAMAGWDAALRDLVLRQQFDAQRRGHRAQYPAASEQLILFADRPIGWMVFDRSGPTWHCVDIAIAPHDLLISTLGYRQVGEERCRRVSLSARRDECLL